ncbi:MAG TPA: hypothetical protein VLL95_13010, partial [Phnomibacter sp.]|nr:hypothetical protein [Phnomibacter sp.]
MNLIIFGGLLGVIMMFTGLLVRNKRQVTLVATALMAVLLLLNTWEMVSAQPVFDVNTASMLATSRFGLLLNEVMLAAGFIYLLLSGRDIEKVGNHTAEYYALIFFIYCGIGISTSYINLLMLFLGIEIISIP